MTKIIRIISKLVLWTCIFAWILGFAQWYANRAMKEIKINEEVSSRSGSRAISSPRVD